ncbi:MAG: hypothetical protein ACI8S6_004331, partial [Myxococcota bacterium]
PLISPARMRESMASWLVTKGEQQFSVRDLEELKQLVRKGSIGPGDIVQPPGASDWLYLIELPELNSLFPKSAFEVDDDSDYRPRSALGQGPIIAALLLLVAFAGYGMYYYAIRVPSNEDLTLDLGLTEMLVTADPAELRDQPGGGSTITTLPKDSRVQLLAKRNDFYAVESATGQKGWVDVDAVIAGYQFEDSRTREDYDPIYNPDRYVFVQNSSWMQLATQREANTSLFQFMLKNKSKFAMTNIVLLATIKDENDRVLEKKEIAIEGTIPAYASAMVGTLLPPEGEEDEVPVRKMTDSLFQELAAGNPELTMRWSAGVEEQMTSENFKEANIDILELSAIPRAIE